MNVPVGRTAKEIRTRLGLSQREAARKIGSSYVHLCNVENGKSEPSPSLLDKMGAFYGIDLYVAAWAMYGDSSRLPKYVRHAARVLGTAWRRALKELTQ